MDQLNRADMPAVLERTNLRPNVENFLLPIYESISNAIYSVQDKWKEQSVEQGKIDLIITTASFSATVADNGIGLDEKNYDKFKTPFTNHRLKRGGKGFGRFVGFKVFERISYYSKHDQGQRSFDFDIYSQPEITNPTLKKAHKFETGCTVYYEGVKDNFQKISESLEPEDIVERIIRYFLPYFIGAQIPEFSITIDGAKFDAKQNFLEFFEPQHEEAIDIEIDGQPHKFDIQISKVKRNSLFQNHAMLLFAGGRIIGSGRNIEGKIGQAYFVNDDGEKQIYISAVSGPYLDQNANTARTQIEMSEDEIDVIVQSISSIILSKEEEFVRSHRKKQSQGVQLALARNPLLRTALGTQSIVDYVSGKPMSWKAEAFVSNLALERYRDQRDWEAEFEAGLKKPETLADMREKIFTKIEQENRDALASYVAHRKSVIQLADAILGLQDDGKMSKEDMFHDLVHPRMEDSDSTKFYQHNLWLIDERLSFFSYISSDRSNSGKGRKKGDKIADLLFFDECSIYREKDNDVIVLVEFKRPGRDNYKYGTSGKDPVHQVIEQAIKIREEERIIATSGRTITIPKGTRLYGYVVADLEPTLRKLCENQDMTQTWDNKGYYFYHKTHDIFIEVLGYDKLVDDARKRNAAFFDILLGDLVD